MRRPSALLAASVLAFGACSGGQSPPLPDTPDPPPPPPPGPLTLRIDDRGTPVPGIVVMFEDSTGGTSIVVTDDQGAATAEVLGRTRVTAVNPFGPIADAGGPIDDLRTMTDLFPFDDIQLAQPAALPDATITVSAPLDPGAATYELRTTCGDTTLVPSGAAATGTLVLRACVPQLDAVLVTREAGGAPRRSIATRVPTPEDGATLTLPNAYAPLVDVQLDVFGSFGFERALGRTYLAARPGRPLYEATFDVAIDSGSATARIPVPPAGDVLRFVEGHLVPRPGDVAQHGVLEVGFGGAQQFIDLGDKLPDVLSRPTFVAPRTLDWGEASFAAAVQLESSVPPPAGPDYVVVELDIVRADDRRARWTAIVKHQPGLAVLPLLHAGHEILLGDTVTVARMTMVDTFGAYEDLRRVLFSGPTELDRILLEAGQGSRLRFQELLPPP